MMMAIIMMSPTPIVAHSMTWSGMVQLSFGFAMRELRSTRHASAKFVARPLVLARGRALPAPA